MVLVLETHLFGNDPDLLLNWRYGDNGDAEACRLEGELKAIEAHELMDQAIAAKDDASRQTHRNQCYNSFPKRCRSTRCSIANYNCGQEGRILAFLPIGSNGLNFIHAKLSKQ